LGVEQLKREFGDEVAKAFVDRVVPALQRAYSFNVARYQPENGDDARYFGTAVWRTSVYELGMRCSELAGAEMVEADICIEMSLAGRTVRVYKMPPRLGDNVEAFTLSGSKVKVAQARSNDEQLTLFDSGLGAVGPDAGPVSFPRLVVLHQGTPIDGLRWVEVGAPSAGGGNWHWHDRIFDAGWDVGDAGDDPVAPKSSDGSDLGITLKPDLLARRSPLSGA